MSQNGCCGKKGMSQIGYCGKNVMSQNGCCGKQVMSQTGHCGKEVMSHKVIIAYKSFLKMCLVVRHLVHKMAIAQDGCL